MRAIRKSIMLGKTTALACALMLMTTALRADTFGAGANAFTVDFVTVGNAGNSDDSGAGGGSYSSPYGGVDYTYRIGVYEISQDQIDRATNAGMTNVTAGAWTGSQPAADMEWYEAAAFVNWLNTSTGKHAAYNLTFNGTWSMALWGASDQATTGVDSGTNPYRHKDAYYFLPSEDEWYKAAYHQNTGVNANYWDYATGSNSIPDGIDFYGDTVFDAVFRQGYSDYFPNFASNVGIASPYGTYGQNGNVWEWNESAYTAPNDSSSEDRAFRGAAWPDSDYSFYSSVRGNFDPSGSFDSVGFRVASVPQSTDNTAAIAALNEEIKKLKTAIKRARKKDQSAKAKRLTKKLKKLQEQLRALED